MNDWAKQRLAELHAAAPVKPKKPEPFVKVPLRWAEAAAKATRTPGMLVLIELLQRSWKARSLTFTLPNRNLTKHGVNRKTKRQKLRDLEAAGLITVERRHGKTPVVTLTML
jgi:DNA-binding HxlR family transcriptional regulator